MPLVLVEKVEHLPEGAIGDVDAVVVALQSVLLEYATVEVRDLANEGGKFRRAVCFGLPQPLVEQPQQELLVEPLKLVWAGPFLDSIESVA